MVKRVLYPGKKRVMPVFTFLLHGHYVLLFVSSHSQSSIKVYETDYVSRVWSKLTIKITNIFVVTLPIVLCRKYVPNGNIDKYLKMPWITIQGIFYRFRQTKKTRPVSFVILVRIGSIVSSTSKY